MENVKVTEAEKQFFRERLMHIMDFVHDVCKREGIKYSLVGGSLIGAIRHKGFIPWDDDMDIAMTRADYERFDRVIGGYCNDNPEFAYEPMKSRIPIVHYSKKPEFDGKRYDGIRVDIIITDNLPDNARKRRRLIFGLKVLQGMMHKEKIDWKKYSLVGKIELFGTMLLGAFRSNESLIRSYKKRSVKYNGEETEEMFFSNDLFSAFSVPYRREWLEEIVEVPFEDRSYCIYAAYDPVLRAQYGDYMTPPPEDSRYGGHITAEE